MDSLTKLQTRNEVQKQLEDGVISLEDYSAAIIFDIDSLAAFNAEYGYVKTDQCLATVAAGLQEVFLDIGRCIRWSGDEFLVLLMTPGRCYELTKQLLEALINRSLVIKSNVTNVEYFSVSACFVEEIEVKNMEDLSIVVNLAIDSIIDEKGFIEPRKFKNQGVLVYTKSKAR